MAAAKSLVRERVEGAIEDGRLLNALENIAQMEATVSNCGAEESPVEATRMQLRMGLEAAHEEGRLVKALQTAKDEGPQLQDQGCLLLPEGYGEGSLTDVGSDTGIREQLRMGVEAAHEDGRLAKVLQNSKDEDGLRAEDGLQAAKTRITEGLETALASGLLQQELSRVATTDQEMEEAKKRIREQVEFELTSGNLFTEIQKVTSNGPASQKDISGLKAELRNALEARMEAGSLDDILQNFENGISA